ncbi:MAG: hypothetical protein R3A79_17495 [Nannocystaceae bacterium]
MPRPSFLCLQFDVDPGGARKDAHWIRATLAEIRADLEAELRDGHSLYYLCWYGARLRLHVFQGGAYERSVDLLPLLRVDIDGYPTITFNADGEAEGYDFEDDDYEGSLSGMMFDDDLPPYRCALDWERVAALVPALREPVVDRGELVNVDGEWIDGDAEMDAAALRGAGYLPYGLTDREI